MKIDQNDSKLDAFNDEEYRELKRKYGEIVELEVDSYTFAFKPPDDYILNESAKLVSEDSDFIGANNVIILNSVLNGLSFLRSQEGELVLRALRAKVGEVISMKKARVKKR